MGCLEGQDPIKDSCCLVTCCRNSRRRLEDVLKNKRDPRDMSEQQLQDKQDKPLEGIFWNVTSASDAVVQTNDHHAKRALLSPRGGRSLQLRSSCEQWFDSPSGDNDHIPGECMCTQSGKSRVCHGSVSVKGHHEKDRELRWMFPIALFVHVVSFLLPFAYVTYCRCTMSNFINPVMDPWTQKGLQCHYQMGSKYSQARISVFVPQTYVVGYVVGSVVP